jgi:hypothetical protein
VRRLVDDLTERHVKEGCWQIPGVPAVSASWAVLEAVNALTLYVEAIEASRWRIACRAMAENLIPRVTALENAHAELQLRAGALAAAPAQDVKRRAGTVALSRRLLVAELFALPTGTGVIVAIGHVAKVDASALIIAGATWALAIPLLLLAARRR